MELTIRKLTEEMYEEYLSYFDDISLLEQDEWTACYCLENHLDHIDPKLLYDKEIRRAKTREMIRQGSTQGYLVYDKDAVIGWCNVGDKTDYAQITANREYEADGLARGVIKVIYCFDIISDYQGKGISHLILDKICKDAANESYQYVEGYPFTDRNFKYQYHGPFYLYEKHGFEIYARKSWFYIMRKKL